MRSSIKAVEDVIACVVDYGTFTALSEKLAESYGKVYYYTPIEKEYQDIKDHMTGFGLKKVIKLDDLFDPAIFSSIDLFIFPDIGYGGLQTHLRSIGKAVWGSMGADQLELHRDLFIQILHDVGLPTIKSKTIQGLTALGRYLKQVSNKWIKVNRYRENMETWYHLDFIHSAPRLNSLAVVFGGACEQVIFVVQDVIESDMECGYDGWCIDGKFPDKSFQGYEKKNELYLGAVLDAKDIPEEITYVNDKLVSVLEEYRYRNWWATEIRVAEGKPYFIDPTCRHPGQTGEHQWETCLNLAEIIWNGAQGNLISPIFSHAFAAEATLHYDALSDNKAVYEEWKILDIPTKMLKWFKPYHYCFLDGSYQFLPNKKDEVGVMLGVGDTVEEALNHLQSNIKKIKELPVHANLSGFTDLLDSIKIAQEHGIKFADKLPKTFEVL